MEIIDIFSEGIIVDDSVCEFIYSFSGRYPDKAFVDMAVRDESFESEAALDLIFFPDPETRSRIEPFIPAAFTSEDERELVEAINTAMPASLLIFKSPGFSTEIDVPERTVGRFVHKLHLCMEIPEKTRELVKGFFPGSREAVFAKIRSFSPGRQSMRLINDFFENYNDIISLDIEDLDVVIMIAEMNPDETDIYHAVRKSFRQWESALKRHEDMERALLSGCIEELMAKGMRMQAINRDIIEKRMMCASRIMNCLGNKDSRAASIHVQDKFPLSCSLIPTDFNH